jgi:hypothetical protein
LHSSAVKRSVGWSTAAPGRRIHDLRHTAACPWLARGVDPVTPSGRVEGADRLPPARATAAIAVPRGVAPATPAALWFPGHVSGTASSSSSADHGTTVTPPGYDQLLGSIAATARETFRAAACSIAVLEPDEQHLVFRVAAGAGAEQVVGLRLPVVRGIAGWAVCSGEAIIVENVERDPRFAREAAESTGYIPHSIMAAPLEIDDAVYGVMKVLDRTRDPRPGEPGLDLLALFARQAALVLQMEALGAASAVSVLADALSRCWPTRCRGVSLVGRGSAVVELRGLEPLTFSLRRLRPLVWPRLARCIRCDC